MELAAKRESRIVLKVLRIMETMVLNGFVHNVSQAITHLTANATAAQRMRSYH